MSFYQDSAGLYSCSALDRLDWLDHGYGTRLAPHWLEDHTTATLHQIHSNRVVHATQPGCLGDGDALFTSRSGLWLAVRTADCVPVILADPVRRLVAMVHCGWRGTIAEIVTGVISHMQSSPPDLVAALGPSIGPCCYEVGPEVGSQFQKWYPERADLNQRTSIDLPETIARQILEAGVSIVDRTRLCTACDPQLESWRRDRDRAGRMTSAVRIRP